MANELTNRSSDPDKANLYDLLRQVESRESFLAFVRAFINDYDRWATNSRNPPNPYDQWENGGDIGECLGASVSWASSMMSEGLFREEPSWSAFARFLYMGKVLE